MENNNEIEVVVKESIEKGRKTLRQHFYNIVKVLVILCIFTLTASKIVQYVSDNKIERLTNEIKEKERKLDSLSISIENRKEIKKQIDINIEESKRLETIYKLKTDEALKEFNNIRKRTSNTDDDYIHVREYLDSIRTRDKEEIK